MGTGLEKALNKLGYIALPLARERCEPTTVFGLERGQIYVVRNPHKSFPNPPIEVTEDAAVDAVELQSEFSLKIGGVASFLLTTLGIGNAKAELEATGARSATVKLGGLVHHTVETGALIDYLVTQDPKSSPAIRDVLDPEHLTVIAAISAATFTYTFRTSKGAVVKLAAPDAAQLFKAGVEVNVNVTESGSVVVAARRFVGVLLWSGDNFTKELQKAAKAARTRSLSATPRTLSPKALAVSAAQMQERQLASVTGTISTRK